MTRVVKNFVIAIKHLNVTITVRINVRTKMVISFWKVASLY